MQISASRNPADTKKLAKSLLPQLRERNRAPIILALSGNLGAGKTTFVQGLAEALGVRDRVQSPTFVLAKWYELGKRFLPFRLFVHIDAYRLDSTRDAKSFGFREIVRNREAIVAIEWADRIRSIIPKHATWISFGHGFKNKRTIRIERP